MKLLKICDVQNIYEARTLGEHGVDFIGLHYVSANDKARSEDLKTIIRLCRQDFPKTKTVLVTKEQDPGALIELINEFECDGVQLHYAASASIVAHLRAEFGDQLLLFSVVVAGEPYDELALDYVDYVILDKNYTGGTGAKITDNARLRLVQKLAGRRVLLAGGIDTNAIAAMNAESIDGFDVQSSVKSDERTGFENISYQKLRPLLAAIGKTPALMRPGQVGFSVSPDDVLPNYFGACDFWHFDFFDDVFGMHTDTDALLAAVRAHARRNSHFRFQIHIFSPQENYVTQIMNELEKLAVKSLEFYIHHDYETMRNYPLEGRAYASLDTKNIISGNFPLKKPLSREKIVLCLQSEHHAERNVNTNTAMRLIDEFWNKHIEVTLDRGISPDDLNYTFDRPVDVVSGRYLREHGKNGYNDLRRSLKNVG